MQCYEWQNKDTVFFLFSRCVVGLLCSPTLPELLSMRGDMGNRVHQWCVRLYSACEIHAGIFSRMISRDLADVFKYLGYFVLDFFIYYLFIDWLVSRIGAGMG